MSEITQEILDKNADISNATIRRDIQDTNVEISALEIELACLRLIAEIASMEHRKRMLNFKVVNRQNALQERREFTEFLESLMNTRMDARIKKDAL